MTRQLDALRTDLLDIVRGGVAAVSAVRLLDRALATPAVRTRLDAKALHVIAAGKAAAAMADAFVTRPGLSIHSALAIGTHRDGETPSLIQWMEAGHPYPDERSERAGIAALAAAHAVAPDAALVLLLSGGASALMAAPIDGVTLADKIAATRVMMEAGADIHALNTLRRHLSLVKGGRLAAACAGTMATLAISDVVGDSLHAIGSGPGVPDPSTWLDASAAVERWGGPGAYPRSVIAALHRGLAGTLAETPKEGDRGVERATAWIIGSRRDAIEGAVAVATARGYDAVVISEPVLGEARAVAPGWLAHARRLAAGHQRPVCVVSAGETTVRVVGNGRGGRNLEFALALAEPLAQSGRVAAAASVGTDGIDGSSGVAGAVVDSTTLARAVRAGVAPPERVLDANDSLRFFEPIGDVIRLGRTDTNVGDLQVLIISAADEESRVDR